MLVGLVAAAVASTWLYFILKEQTGQRGAASPFLAASGFVAVAQPPLGLRLRIPPSPTS
jgi:hypothetical protein